jgi:hypothetical protein
MRACSPLLVAVLVLAACGRSADRGVGGSYAAPPQPPLKADPAAGRPVVLANSDNDVLVLDAHARIRRVFSMSDTTPTLCPGGRVLADASDFDGRVEVRSIEARLRWKTKIPRGTVYETACLDADGDRVLVVLGAASTSANDTQRAVYLVSASGARRLDRTVGEVALITPTRLWVPSDDGLTELELPSLEPLRSYDDVPVPAWLELSPDGRWAVITSVENGVGPYRLSLLDLASGKTRSISEADAQVIGWFAPDRIAVHAGAVVQLFGIDGREQDTIDAKGADQVILAEGALIASRGPQLFTLRGPTSFAGGTLPRSAWLLGVVE